MPKVELIYDAACPNVEAARQQLRQAFHALSQSPAWEEWDREDPSSPAHARQYGSPTILVDGKDVMGVSPWDAADCCRVYHSGNDSLHGVPPVEVIIAALRNRAGNNGAGALRSWLAVLPAAALAMLPKLACPACWPAYAALLSSLGLGFLAKTAYLLPLTLAFLVAAVGALGFRARSRQGSGPFAAGLAAAFIITAGKFHFESDAAMYGGIALLIAASAWNAWPKRNRIASCPSCAGTGNHS